MMQAKFLLENFDGVEIAEDNVSTRDIFNSEV